MVRESYEEFVMDRQEDTFGGDIVAAASPATKIVVVYLGVTLVVGGILGTFLYSNPELFGKEGYARLAGLVVLGLTAIGLVRFAVKYVILLRTKYIVTDDSVRREYKLAYREESRELPLHMIRGVETSRSRLQALLGYATISFLAVGSNRGIGYVEFDNAANPEKLQTAILELMERQADASEAPAAGSSGGATAGDRSTGSGPSPDATSDGDANNASRTRDASTANDVSSAVTDASDEPLAESGDDARRPVAGNDDSPRAEPDPDED